MNSQWIEQATTITDPKQLDELIKSLRKSNANLVTEYEAAQIAAGEYLKHELDIPSGLVSAIQLLGSEPSGFTGISVYQAFVEIIRQKNSTNF